MKKNPRNLIPYGGEMRDEQVGMKEEEKNRKQQTNHIEKHVKQRESNGTRKAMSART